MTLQEIIAESHDDLPIWSSVTVGFEDDKSLTVLLEHDDYDEPDYAYRIYATVDKHDALDMARRLNVPLTALPSIIFKRYGDTSNLSVPSEVEAAFKDILDFILDCGVRYRLKREDKP